MRIRCVAALPAALVTVTAAHCAPVVQQTLTLGNNTQAIAIDKSLIQVYVTNRDSAAVSVIDRRLNVTTISVGPNPRRIEANSATHRVYVSNENSPGTVTVIDGTTNAVVKTIAVGNGPRGLGSNFLIGRVYVANTASNTVSVVDAAANAVVATIAVGTGPGGPSSNNILKKLYVPSNTDNTVTVIDEGTNSVLKTVPVGKGPITATVDAQHGKVYVNNATDKTISVINSATDTVTAVIPVGAAVTGGNGNFGVVSPVYHRLYLPNGGDGTLSIISTDSDSVARTVAVGSTPLDMVVDADGGNLYVVNQGSNSVSIMSASSESIIDTLAVGAAPWRMLEALGYIAVLNNGTTPASVTVATTENTLANTAIATEFYHAAFNHYFHTADETETQLLIDGLFADDWHRTFQFWRVWTAPATGKAAAVARLPVCRFFSTAFGAKSSHFYTPYAAECQKLQTDPALSSAWQLESTSVYYMALPDAGGNCAAGTVPLYRVYNNGQGGAPNHRYMVDRTLRDQMLQAGWIAEGSGPDVAFACVPTLLNG